MSKRLTDQGWTMSMEVVGSLSVEVFKLGKEAMGMI